MIKLLFTYGRKSYFVLAITFRFYANLIEYLYAFVEKTAKKAVVVIRTENSDGAIKALKDGRITVLSAKELYNL